MKYLILTMALISAFFVSTVSSIEPDLSDLKSPKFTSTWCVKAFGIEGCGEDKIEASENACKAYLSQRPLPESSADRRYTRQECEEGMTPDYRWYYQQMCTSSSCRGEWLPESRGRAQSVSYTDMLPDNQYSCPPLNAPSYFLSVPKSPTPEEAPFFDCAKELETPIDLGNDCDEFGLDNWLPENGTNVQGSVCYTNPVTGKQCQYSKNDIAGYKSSGEECTGEEPP